MSKTIPFLLQLNTEVFSENDPVRRRAMLDEFYAEDCTFFDPSNGVHRGREAINKIAGVIKAMHPDFKYQPIAEPDVAGEAGRIRWVSGPPGAAPEYAGTDIVIVREGRIAAIYLFFDKLP